MELNHYAAEAARKHVERSIVEMSDDHGVERWQSGERVDEEVNEIMQPWIEAAMKLLEQRSEQNVGK